MPSPVSPLSPQWREKANEFLSSSGVKLKQAGNSAGVFAKDAGENVVDIAGRFGSVVRSRWALLRQASQRPGFRDNMQERILTAAASTGTLVKKGLSETKDKVAIGKMKVEEAAKVTAHKSRSILNDIERWQKQTHSSDIGQMCRLPCIIRYYLLIILVSYWNAPLPEGISPINVAALVKCYLASLPEPLTTFEHYHAIRDARSSVRDMRNALKRLPNVSFMTLEFVTALLLRVSQKSSLNKMDANSLAIELAPVIMWQKGAQRSDFSSQFWQNSVNLSNVPSSTMNPPTYTAWDSLSDEDDVNASSTISLDDGSPTDLGAMEVVQCLIEHHNPIFTDANETTWSRQ
ncbi:hypothetical protein ACLOJK_005643 [Asimina triloba]